MSDSGQVDRSRRFLPDRITHLYYSPIYQTLSEAQRLRYNQLFACYFNEQIIFFESRLTRYFQNVLRTVESAPAAADDIRRLIETERRHTAMYRGLNRLAAPELYAESEFYFVPQPAAPLAVMAAMMRAPRAFPLFLWLALLQEERSVYYSREIEKDARELEGHFVDVNRRHRADEAEHVVLNQSLLDLLWRRNRAWVRRVNARLFVLLVGEYFNTPKRAGIRIARRLAREFPELRPMEPRLAAETAALRENAAFHRSLYSREIVPCVFQLLDENPEFGELEKVMLGYQRAGGAA